MKKPDRQASEVILMMSELDTLANISAYIAKNNLKMALEVEGMNRVVESYVTKKEGLEPKPPDKSKMGLEHVELQSLDYIYNDEPLGFEKDPITMEKM